MYDIIIFYNKHIGQKLNLLDINTECNEQLMRDTVGVRSRVMAPWRVRALRQGLYTIKNTRYDYINTHGAECRR